MPDAKRPLGLWLLLAAAVIVVDQASKQWVLDSFRLHELRPVTDFFNLVLVFNSGAAFSFLAGAGGWQKWFFVSLALGISIWLLSLLRQHAGERLLPLAVSLILAGALGNMIDRIRFDFRVTDFISVGNFYIFNVADASVTVGVIVFVLWAWLKEREAAKQAVPEVAEGEQAEKVDEAKDG